MRNKGAFEVETKKRHLCNVFIKKVIILSTWKFIIRVLSHSDFKQDPCAARLTSTKSFSTDKAHVFP